jgi:hypothetical protein
LKSAYFEIPANQREYRWGVDQWEKLWGDLLQTIEKDSLNGNEHAIGHFLGAVVVIGGEQSLDQDRWQVIDGQQRLTTITILAECLRPYVSLITDKKVERSLDHVLTSCVLSLGKEDVTRLRLNREDEFYSKSLLECNSFDDKQSYWNKVFNPKSEVQENLRGAFLYFDGLINQYLEDSVEGDRGELIRNLAETLTESFYLLLVRTENFWMAYRLFETLNERGLDLSQADLIRNILLEDARLSGDSVFAQVSKLWGQITDNYESQSSKKLELPQVIQFSYTYRHALVKKESLFDMISSDLRKNRFDGLELASEFYRDSSNWCDFLLGDLMNWSEELADSQYAIMDPLWKMHCTPFVIAAMDRYTTSRRELEVCFALCENFLFRQGLICNDSVSSLQEFFAEAAAQLKSSQDIDRLIELFIKKSPEEPFVENFKIFSAKNMKQGFYILWKIENYLASDVEFRPKSQSAAQHLEHIMPRNPSAEWMDVEKDELFKSNLNRIGNLLILTKKINLHIKNKPIGYKIENESGIDYTNSELKIVSNFVEKFNDWAPDGRWSFQSIAMRQKYLAEQFASSVWSLNLTL